jgi:hypothetical protein
VLDALAQLRQVPVHQDEAALVVPERFSEKHVVAAQDILDYTFVTVIRLVPSTQEYKVLRVLEDSCSSSPEQLYKIFTIDGRQRYSLPRRRGKKASPIAVSESHWESVAY